MNTLHERQLVQWRVDNDASQPALLEYERLTFCLTGLPPHVTYVMGQVQHAMQANDTGYMD